MDFMSNSNRDCDLPIGPDHHQASNMPALGHWLGQPRWACARHGMPQCFSNWNRQYNHVPGALGLPRCPGTQKVVLGESPWAVHGAAFTRQVSRMLCLTGCCYDPRSPLADDDRQLRTHIHWTSLIGSLALDEEDRTEHHLRDERTPLHPKALLNRGLHLKQQGKHSTVYCLAWLWCAVL
jgi:hypothetical protein